MAESDLQRIASCLTSDAKVLNKSPISTCNSPAEIYEFYKDGTCVVHAFRYVSEGDLQNMPQGFRTAFKQAAKEQKASKKASQ